MSKTLLTATLAAVLCAGLAAQDQTQPRQPQTQTPPAGGAAAPATPDTQAPPTASPSTQRPTQSAAAANTITIQGCIQRNAGASSATPGATGTAGSSSDAFILANAMRPAGSSASPSATIASSYRLEAEASKLSPHVGHKVELTGTVDAASAAAPSPSGANAPSSAPGATTSAGATSSAPAASMANAPRFKVTDVKMLAATCTP